MTDKDTNTAAIATELAGPLLQAVTIATLLILTYGDPVPTLFAIVAGLIWLHISKGQYADQVGMWRAARDLYVQLGEWLERRDAGQTFDAVLAERMKVDQGIEHDDFDGLLLGQNIGNAARALIGYAVQIYLIVVIVLVVWKRVGAPG